jgi:hypothetical protein
MNLCGICVELGKRGLKCISRPNQRVLEIVENTKKKANLYEALGVFPNSLEW